MGSNTPVCVCVFVFVFACAFVCMICTRISTVHASLCMWFVCTWVCYFSLNGYLRFPVLYTIFVDLCDQAAEHIHTCPMPEVDPVEGRASRRMSICSATNTRAHTQRRWGCNCIHSISIRAGITAWHFSISILTVAGTPGATELYTKSVSPLSGSSQFVIVWVESRDAPSCPH